MTVTQTPIPTPIPDSQLVELWSFERSGQISEPVRREYARYLSEFSRTVKPLTEATTMDLRTFLAARADRWQPSTMMIVRRAMRSFYGWATEAGIVADNPALPIAAFKTPEPPVLVATVEHRTKLIAVCATARDRALIHILFGSGARRSEVAALGVADVDLTGSTIRIVKSKTGRGRVAVIDREARVALTEWMVERVKLPVDSDALWITRRLPYRPMTPLA